MNIQKEEDKVRLQLYDFKHAKLLFDFTVEKEDFVELKEHIIDHLNEFRM